MARGGGAGEAGGVVVGSPRLGLRPPRRTVLFSLFSLFVLCACVYDLECRVLPA